MESSFKANWKQFKPKDFKIFYEKLHRLFDIVACTCKIIHCGDGLACRSKDDCTGFHIYCSCSPDRIIPEKEVRFIKDQRTAIRLLGGEMFMNGRDTVEAKQQREKYCIRETLTLSTCEDSSTNTIFFFLNSGRGVRKQVFLGGIQFFWFSEWLRKMIL